MAKQYGKPGLPRVIFLHPQNGAVLEPRKEVDVSFRLYNYDFEDGSRAAINCGEIFVANSATMINDYKVSFPSQSFEKRSCEVWLLDKDENEVLSKPSAITEFRFFSGFSRFGFEPPLDHQGKWEITSSDGHLSFPAGSRTGVLIRTNTERYDLDVVLEKLENVTISGVNLFAEASTSEALLLHSALVWVSATEVGLYRLKIPSDPSITAIIHNSPSNLIQIVPDITDTAVVVKLHVETNETAAILEGVIQTKDRYDNNCTTGGDSLYCRLIGTTPASTKTVMDVVDHRDGTYQIMGQIDDPGVYQLQCKIEYRNGEGNVDRDPPATAFSSNFGTFVPSLDLSSIPVDQGVSFIGQDLLSSPVTINLNNISSSSSSEDPVTCTSAAAISEQGRWLLLGFDAEMQPQWEYVPRYCKLLSCDDLELRSWFRHKRTLMLGDSVLYQMAKRLINRLEGNARKDILQRVITSMYTMDIRLVDRHVIHQHDDTFVDFVHMRGMFTMELDQPDTVASRLKLHEQPPHLLILNPGLHDVCSRSRSLLLDNTQLLIKFLKTHFPTTKIIWMMPTAVHFNRCGYPYHHTRSRVEWAAATLKAMALDQGFSVIDTFAMTRAAAEECPDGTHYNQNTYDALFDVIMTVLKE